MLLRSCAVAVPSLAFSLLTGCGTTTSVGGPVSDDAGCASVVLDGGVVVDPPEAGAPLCPSGVCNYQAQTGCPTGQACRPQFNASSPTVSPGCEPAGAGKAGTACTSGSGCAAGYYCAASVCRKQCCGSDRSECEPGESCIRQLEVKAGGVVIDSGMDLCFPVNDCDPLVTGPCASDPTRECKIVDPSGAVACEPLSTLTIGDACDPARPCAAGAVCAGGACRALCRAEACGQPACAADEGTCVHFNRDPVGVGECTPL